MKQFIWTMFALFVILGSTTQVAAQDTRVGFGAAVVYPVSLETGDGLKPSSVYTLRLLQPMNGWALVSSVGVNIGFERTQLRPQLTIGPSWRIGEGPWAVGTSALYRYIPSQGENDNNHFVGVSGAIVHSGGPISVSLFGGPGYLVRNDAWSMALGIGIGKWF